MKKILTLVLVSIFTFTSCSDEGPQGPQGPPGEPGEDGLIGSVIDIVGDFNEGNDYSLQVEFNDFDLEVFETDAVLVYLKTGEDGEADGEPVDVFRMLPQTYYIDGQPLQYNFDYTFFSVLIFLDGTVNFGDLDASFTDDQELRIVVVPAGFANNSGVDISNMKAVINALDIEEKNISKIKISD